MSDRRQPQTRRGTTDRRGDDRRSDARYSSQAGIRFLRASAKEDGILHGQLLDASRSGIRILLAEPPQPRETLLVEARGADGHCLNLTAKVVWIETTPGGQYRVGCELGVELSDRGRRLLKQFAGDGLQSGCAS